jgi:hypothetical protein
MVELSAMILALSVAYWGSWWADYSDGGRAKCSK